MSRQFIKLVQWDLDTQLHWGETSEVLNLKRLRVCNGSMIVIDTLNVKDPHKAMTSSILQDYCVVGSANKAPKNCFVCKKVLHTLFII